MMLRVSVTVVAHPTNEPITLLFDCTSLFDCNYL